MASRRIGMFGVEPSEFIDDRNEDGVAALLRRRREELGRDVATVARQLRIRAIYIQAIEDGRLQDLPGTAYAVGFVRAYADYLGLDGNSIVSDYRDELARRSRQNQLIWPVDQVEHKHFPGGIILVVSLVVAVVLYGGWYFASQPGGTGIDLIDQVPEFMKKQADEPAAGQAPEAAEDVASQATASTPTSIPSADDSSAETAPSSAQASQSSTVPATTDTPTNADASSTIAPETSPAAAAPAVPAEGAGVPTASVGTAPALPAAGTATDPAQPAAPATAATPDATALTGDAATAPTVPGANALATDPATVGQTAPTEQQAAVPTGEAAIDPAAAESAVPTPRIVLRAAKDSWVEIFDSQQNVVLQRILRAGESYAVPDQSGLVMNTGNAGGLVIELDGQAQPSLGSVGVVKRGIKLEPAALNEQ